MINAINISLISLIILIMFSYDNDRKNPKQVSADPNEIHWGNAVYVDLSIGGSFAYMGKTITLKNNVGHCAVVEVDGIEEKLKVARRALPRIINGVRIFIAMNRNLVDLTTNKNYPLVFGALKNDALICISDPSLPLLDQERFIFPVNRNDGYEWTMEESSHMFAYSGPDRAHNGIDLDMTPARGKEVHAIQAIEASRVFKIDIKNQKEARVILQSMADTVIYYTYAHLNRDKLFVKEGQVLQRGQKIAFIWGDKRWGHLHFSVACQQPDTSINNRYQYLLNFFPQLYELWFDELEYHTPIRAQDHFLFGNQYWRNGNKNRLSSYDDVVGYGWLLDDENIAQKVASSLPDERNNPAQNARLHSTLHSDTPFPAKKTTDFFDFEIKVPKGQYLVKARVGDLNCPTWQKILFENQEAGMFELLSAEYAWTAEFSVPVEDDKLTVRIFLKNDSSYSGLRELYFIRQW